MSSEILLFARPAVTKAKRVVRDPDAPADPAGGGPLADWAMRSLHALRIELGKSSRVTRDLRSEMPGVLAEIGLTRLPHHPSFRDWFETIPMKTWRPFLDASVEEQSGHAAIDSTGFDRDQPSRHCARRAHYDDSAFRDELRERGIRPFIDHRIYWALDNVHNARMDSARFNQRWMAETVFPSLERPLGATVRARSWNLKFREMLLWATGYNLRRTVRYPRDPPPYTGTTEHPARQRDARHHGSDASDRRRARAGAYLRAVRRHGRLD